MNVYNLWLPDTPMYHQAVETHIEFDACTKEMLIDVKHDDIPVNNNPYNIISIPIGDRLINDVLNGIKGKDSSDKSWKDRAKTILLSKIKTDNNIKNIAQNHHTQ
mgnify:CR=1 FL=1